MKTLLTFLLLISLTNTVFAAGSDSDDTVVKPKNYSKVKRFFQKVLNLINIVKIILIN